jgi:hypothetical protein
MATKNSYLGEKFNPADESDRALKDMKALESVNFERQAPLTEGATYILLPQENTAAVYTIPGVGDRVSRRFWAVELNRKNEPVSIRSIGYSSIAKMGYQEKTSAQPAAPEVPAYQDKEGKWHPKRGLSYVFSCEDHNFIKANPETMLMEIKTPTALKVMRRAEVWVASFKDQALVVKDGMIVPEVDDRFVFFKTLVAPTEDIVEACKKVLENEDSIQDCLYLL